MSNDEYQHQNTFKTMKIEEYVVLTAVTGGKIYLNPNIQPTSLTKSTYTPEGGIPEYVSYVVVQGFSHMVAEEAQDIMDQYEEKRTNKPIPVSDTPRFDPTIFGEIESQAEAMFLNGNRPCKVLIGDDKFIELLSLVMVEEEMDKLSDKGVENVFIITKYGGLTLQPSENSTELTVISVHS